MTNTIDNIFEYATRTKLRFQFKGQLSVEELWDLTFDELEAIFGELNALKEKNQVKSLSKKKSATDEQLEAKIQLVEFIYRKKEAEKESKVAATQLKQQEAFLKETLAAKKQEALLSKSPEEIEALLQQVQEKQKQI